MNIPDKIVKLIRVLIKKTVDKEITWSQTSRETEYSLIFNDGSIFTTDSWLNSAGERWVDCSIFNSNGVRIETFAFERDNLDVMEEYHLLNTLYSCIQEGIFRKNETIDNMLNLLGDE